MARKLPARLIRELGDADFILHAGDWTSEAVYDELARYAPVEGVAGNNDGEAVYARFGLRKIVTIGGVRIGLVHGHGPGTRETAEQRALKAFEAEEADAVVFGHSHIPLLRREGERLFFNPGSPTDKRRQRQYSFGILEIAGSSISAEHIYYDSKD